MPLPLASARSSLRLRRAIAAWRRAIRRPIPARTPRTHQAQVGIRKDSLPFGSLPGVPGAVVAVGAGGTMTVSGEPVGSVSGLVSGGRVGRVTGGRVNSVSSCRCVGTSPVNSVASPGVASIRTQPFPS